MNRESIDWHTYYRAQAGGDYNYFKGSRFQEGYGLGGYYIQQGSGLGGMFRKFASWTIPIVKKYAVPSLKSGAEALGREALQSASNVAKDVLSGVNDECMAGGYLWARRLRTNLSLCHCRATFTLWTYRPMAKGNRSCRPTGMNPSWPCVRTMTVLTNPNYYHSWKPY